MPPPLPNLNNPVLDDPDSVYEDIEIHTKLIAKAESLHAELLNILVPESYWNESLNDTPKRVIKSLREMTKGYNADVKAILGRSFEDQTNYDQMVLVRGIEFTSLCEHHMLPFVGVAHVAYIPEGRVVGLSKLARVVDAYSRRLQIQERLTAQIARAVAEYLPVKSAACIIRAKHMCMSCRGVHKPDAETVTSVLLGEFFNPEVRIELLQLIGQV